MRISNSDINFNSTHRLSISENKVSSQALSTNGTNVVNSDGSAIQPIGESVNLNGVHTTSVYSEKNHHVYSQSLVTDTTNSNDSSTNKTLITQEQIAQSVVAAMTGTAINLTAVSLPADESSRSFFVDDISNELSAGSTDTSLSVSQSTETQSTETQSTETRSTAPQMTTIQINERSVYQEAEHSFMSAEGLVTTADGREIDFRLDLELDRFYLETEVLNLTASSEVLYDPLVISLDGSPASLTSNTFLFDIDSDGIEDRVSELGAGVGYLAFDENQDGIINDGSELFGTQSGNGFEDLAIHDSDRNGWIDEDDEIFTQLKVWQRDAEGNNSLTSLKDAGVGAIYLGSVSTEFSLTDDNNELLGQVRRSGVYLKETGEVMSVQQIDLVIQQDRPATTSDIENRLNAIQDTFDNLNTPAFDLTDNNTAAITLNDGVLPANVSQISVVNLEMFNMNFSSFNMINERAIQSYEQQAEIQVEENSVPISVEKQILDSLFKQLEIKNTFDDTSFDFKLSHRQSATATIIEEILKPLRDQLF